MSPQTQLRDSSGGGSGGRMQLDTDSPLLRYYSQNLKEDRAEPRGAEPTELDTSAVHFLEVGTDKLSVKYRGDARHENDVGSIQANAPVPANVLIYYYEVKVISGGDHGRIAVGFADGKFRQGSHPGCESNSYGYHGEDGFKCEHGDGGEQYGPSFGSGDVIGAGINVGKGEIFFTYNGRNLGLAFKGAKRVLYPTVGLHSANEHLQVNFGARPFVFDIQGLVAEERQKHQVVVSRMEVAPGVTHSIVRDYLTHFGYGSTLAAFNAAAGFREGEEAPTTNGAQCSAEVRTARDSNGVASRHADAGKSLRIEFRQRVKAMITSGDVDGATRVVRQTCPHLLSASTLYPDAGFFLGCQKYIELIRLGEVHDAMSHAQEEMASYRGSSPKHDALMSEIFALVAYEDPQSCPLSYLLSSKHREVVADIVNVVIVSDTSGSGGTQPSRCLLEQSLAQLSTVHNTFIEYNEGRGEKFSLRPYLERNNAA
mmetsp:Transcript_31838/g.82435  ORF Transcript_31838/g.82435 Transcript_31838/m.82435 type:complete len:483 (-) Transcript_31838:738-2186(-)